MPFMNVVNELCLKTFWNYNYSLGSLMELGHLWCILLASENIVVCWFSYALQLQVTNGCSCMIQWMVILGMLMPLLVERISKPDGKSNMQSARKMDFPLIYILVKSYNKHLVIILCSLGLNSTVILFRIISSSFWLVSRVNH